MTIEVIDVPALVVELTAAVEAVDDWEEIVDPLLDEDTARGFRGHAGGWTFEVARAWWIQDGLATHEERNLAVKLPAPLAKRGVERALALVKG